MLFALWLLAAEPPFSSELLVVVSDLVVLAGVAVALLLLLFSLALELLVAAGLAWLLEWLADGDEVVVLLDELLAVAEAVALGVDDGEALAVADGEAVALAVGDGVALGVALGVAVAVGAGVIEEDGVAIPIGVGAVAFCWPE
ncbi:MAG: hypothetical protein M3Y80_01510 [Verrucomicrobiota bacterium]|nr:hypothetical protein [Verrucomicrobiota bacterium]